MDYQYLGVYYGVALQNALFYLVTYVKLPYDLIEIVR